MNYGHQNPKNHLYPPHPSIYRPVDGHGSPPCYYPQITLDNRPLQPIVAPPPLPTTVTTSYAPRNKGPPPSTQSGLGIKVVIKPELQLTPPPLIEIKAEEVPRSTFGFDFELEKKILAEAENWNLDCHDEDDNLSRLNPNDGRSSSSSSTYLESHEEYLAAVQQLSAMGIEEEGEERQHLASLDPLTCDGSKEESIDFTLNKDAYSIAVLNYGDNSSKITEFVKGYKVLVGMGFPSRDVTDALLIHVNDTEKASAYLLDNS